MSLERIPKRDESKLRYYVACHGLGVFFSSFGRVLEHQALYAVSRQRCTGCNGLGFTERQARCLRCHGSGAREPKRIRHQRNTGLWIKPRGTEETVDIQDWRLAELGEVHRRLAAIDRTDPQSVQVLCAWYDYERTALQDVWEYTPAGKTLARRHPDWSAEQCFSSLRRDQEATGDRTLAELFDAADKQAISLIKKAGLLWNLNK